MNELDDLVKEFLVESNENLDQLDRDLVVLESNPTSQEILSRIFRAVHTIKGTTGFLGFGKLESVAHAGENLLSKLRDGVLTLNPEITSALLATVDAVREMLARIEASGQDGDGDYTVLIECLTALQSASRTVVTAPQPGAPKAATEPPPEGAQPVSQAATPSPNPKAEPVPEVRPIGEILVANGRATPDQVASAIEKQMEGDPRHVGEILVEQGAVQPAEVVEALKTQNETRASAVAASNIRVDVSQLDKLMNLVGELVLARNQILQFSDAQKDAAFLGTTQRLNLITTELQEGVMKTRMQPIDNIWNKFPRVVRDLAMSCGKRVRVEMEGNETELDKTLIEAIKDPLTHIVRNSVDHGIERPEQRIAAGKPAEGRLFLRAYHEGGQVNIEISDDGGGIAVERVKRKALDRGLISAERGARMSDHEAVNLIFLPGLSTAEKVSNVSGRGVGMDVVKTNIEKISGTIDVQSQLGEGTTLKIRIPLTLAIIPALIVSSAGDRYAIPQISLLELVRLEGKEARKGIESIHGAPVYRLRGNLLPLAYLNRELGLEPPAAGERDVINIVVLQADRRQFGLIVDAVNDTEEIVVKPLGKHLKAIETFAGATIMGDGRVALILDVVAVAHGAGVISKVRERTLAESGDARTQRGTKSLRALLLFASTGGRMAVPLDLVTRLEEFPRSGIERTGSHEVVQYRGSILPIVRVSSLLPERRHKAREQVQGPTGSDNVQVVVYSRSERSVGLIVERILDIVEEDMTRLQPASREGVQGCLAIQGRVTEILDLEGLIRTDSALRSVKDFLPKASG